MNGKRGGGIVTCHLIAAAVEAHCAVDVAAAMQKFVMMVEDGEEVEEWMRACIDIRVDFETGSVLCHQSAVPLSRWSQSIIFSLSNRPCVRCVRHHMHDDFDKTPSFVDLRVAQQVPAARGKCKQHTPQSCNLRCILPSQRRHLIFLAAPQCFPPNHRTRVQGRRRLPRPGPPQPSRALLAASCATAVHPPAAPAPIRVVAASVLQ